MEPFLPDGEKARSDEGYLFNLYGSRDAVTCVVYVDGNNHFMASANRGYPIEWSTEERAGGTRLAVGERGLIWDSGTVTYFVCKRPDSSDKIQLHLSGDIPEDVPKARRLLADLTKKYLAFAQKQLGCQF
ncbi:hypothetical protein [Streptomyces sp. NPDC048623]|uniref:hypothetical protein n=1 Tax=Streptomyces sp. NPDC048623 TaxID=3155761 RepID=UPI00342FC457